MTPHGMNENVSKEINKSKKNKEINTEDQQKYVFNSNKLLYICCDRPNGLTVRHTTLLWGCLKDNILVC